MVEMFSFVSAGFTLVASLVLLYRKKFVYRLQLLNKGAQGEYTKFIKPFSVYVYLSFCKLFGISPTVLFYFGAKDFHSYLAACALQQAIKRFNFHVSIILLPLDFHGYGCDDKVAFEWSFRDGNDIAKLYTDMISARPSLSMPSDEEFKSFHADIQQNSNLDFIVEAASKLWSDKDYPIRSVSEAKSLSIPLFMVFAGTIRLAFDDFWGIGRMSYLENVLIEYGFNKAEESAAFTRTRMVGFKKEKITKQAPHPVKLYWSFRSPYSAICLQRFYELVDAYNLTVEYCLVLPMVKRKRPVSLAKEMYVFFDCVREAKHYGVQFGEYTYDPLHSIEIGFDLFTYSQTIGEERKLLLAWAKFAWDQAYDFRLEEFQRKFIDYLGWDWNEASKYIQDPLEPWRKYADKNSEDLSQHGLWGVPSFGYGKEMIWGNDRLWKLEELIIESC